MHNILENDQLKVEMKPEGAELISIIGKADKTEYLWQADPVVWNRHAPILFPIVGTLKNGQGMLDEKAYHMSRHGFARDCTFDSIEATAESVCYQLTDSEATKEQYPYTFSLQVKYQLRGNQIIVTYQVQNQDEVPMYFSIGAHPGFNCPLFPGENLEDYYLEWSHSETLDRLLLTQEGFLSGVEKEYLKEQKKLVLSPELFKNDALIFENFVSDSISLKSINHNKGVTVTMKGFPYVGLWGKPNKTPFVCIEPWYGITDEEKTDGDFTKKKGIRQLQPKETFTCEYVLSID